MCLSSCVLFWSLSSPSGLVVAGRILAVRIVVVEVKSPFSRGLSAGDCSEFLQVPQFLARMFSQALSQHPASFIKARSGVSCSSLIIWSHVTI